MGGARVTVRLTIGLNLHSVNYVYQMPRDLPSTTVTIAQLLVPQVPQSRVVIGL